MKVTAAITTYNRAAFLPGALESIFAQTRPADEVLVVDDGSTDDTRGVLAGYGDRVRVVRQENAGRSGARNRAVEEARGELLSFLDSDDRWLPSKLERQVPVLEND
jgi:glycosyltransferase involved in cell wall biosynthesis